MIIREGDLQYMRPDPDKVNNFRIFSGGRFHLSSKYNLRLSL